VALLGCAMLAACVPRVDSVRAPTSRFVYSPYKHVAVGWRDDAPAVATGVTGAWTPLAEDGRSHLPAGVNAVTLAFATGECGAERWDDVDAADVARAIVPAFVRAGIDYVVSTGGEAGTFTCQSDDGMEAFVARYDSPRLIGFDFDIERGQSDAVLDALAQRIGAAQRRHPALRFSVTLATWAGSDETRASLNTDGMRVLDALRRAGVADYLVNLMVMDYGEARRGNCVLDGAVCDMGRSAIQAARNLRDRFGVPLARVELTPMIGVNDVVSNVFTLDDARTVARFAREAGLAGVHFWSLDRDVACPGNAHSVSSLCHGMPGLAPFAYAATFRDALR
jgi:hypothetical protein